MTSHSINALLLAGLARAGTGWHALEPGEKKGNRNGRPNKCTETT